MNNGDKENSSCTENEDKLDDLKLIMASANDKYHNSVKKLSAM